MGILHSIIPCINVMSDCLYVMCCMQRTGSLIAAGIASVQVQVLDVNDQAPVFVPASLIATVEEDAPFGTSVARLRVSNSVLTALPKRA